MALQTLKVWAKSLVPDSVKGNEQIREIRDEEWLQGWGRLAGVTNQQLNSLFRLITQHSAPADVCAYLYPDSAPITDVMLKLDGQSITSASHPVLFETYGGNLPDLTSEQVTGFIWVVRKQ